MLIELYFSLLLPRSTFRLVHCIGLHHVTLITHIDMIPHPPFLSAIARSPSRPVSTSPAPTSLALHPSIQAAFGIDDIQFITKLNKTFPLQETIDQERKMMGLPPMAVPELPANWEEPRRRACRFGSREVGCFSYRGVPA
jgi:hypothetical protein